MQIELTGTTGDTYTLNASADLVNWTPLVTYTNLNGPVRYSDLAASNFPTRFYRLAGTPPIAATSSYKATLGPPFSPVPTAVTIYTPSQTVTEPPSWGNFGP